MRKSDLRYAPHEVIDEILCAEFGYPLAERRGRARLRHFLGRSERWRLATRFGTPQISPPDFELTERFFARTPHERVKAFVAVPSGSAPSNEGRTPLRIGNAYYVHLGATEKAAPKWFLKTVTKSRRIFMMRTSAVSVFVPAMS